MKENNPYYDPLGLEAHLTKNGNGQEPEKQNEDKEYIPGWDF